MWAWIKETYICDADENPSVLDSIAFFGIIAFGLIVAGFCLYGIAMQ